MNAIRTSNNAYTDKSKDRYRENYATDGYLKNKV